jgi:hypothetical protein
LIKVDRTDQKLLFEIVEAVLEAGGKDVDPQLSSDDLQRLRNLGLLEEAGSYPSKKAFLEYFSSFELLSPPPEVENWARALAKGRIYWRRPIGRMKKLMAPQHRGRSFPLLATVFIGRHADMGTWFHELGHIVYTRLTPEEKTCFARRVRDHGSILHSDGAQTCIDPGSREEVKLPKGEYLVIGAHLLGLDHSGADEEAINDECWAVIFGVGFTNTVVPAPIADAFETIIERLKREIAH